VDAEGDGRDRGQRFYKHGGVDYEGIVARAVKDLARGQVVQGGSTITQQLVRNLYISRKRTFKRKIKEACLAIKLARQVEGLDPRPYMNAVYYGNHAYGSRLRRRPTSRARASTLTLDQSRCSPGCRRRPRLRPDPRPRDALERRDEVLRAMLDNGRLTRAQFASAIAGRQLHLVPGSLYTRIREPYFFSYVRDQLIAEYGANTSGPAACRSTRRSTRASSRGARRRSSDTLYSRTDRRRRSCRSIRDGRDQGDDGRDAGQHGNSSTSSRRQSARRARPSRCSCSRPRSTRASIRDHTYYVSEPFHYQPDPYSPAWDVPTYDHTYLGSTSIENATLHSDNTVYAQLTLDVGPEEGRRDGDRLGVARR
jgi:penicillin-binding protein 1A